MVKKVVLAIIMALLCSCASPPFYKENEEGRQAALKLATDDEAEIYRRWGDLAAAVNVLWAGYSSDGDLYKYTLNWLVRGSVMEERYSVNRETGASNRYSLAQYNPDESRIDYYFLSRVDNDLVGYVALTGRVQAGGAVLKKAHPAIFGWLGPAGSIQFDQENQALLVNVDGKVVRLKSVTTNEYQKMLDKKMDLQSQARQKDERESRAFRQGLYSGLKDMNETISSQRHDSNVINGNSTGTTTTSPSVANGASTIQKAPLPQQTAPLRFVLLRGLERTGEKYNAICISNIITIEGPPGWGYRSADGEARKLITPYYGEFERRCSEYAELSPGSTTYVLNNSYYGQKGPSDIRINEFLADVRSTQRGKYEVHIDP